MVREAFPGSVSGPTRSSSGSLDERWRADESSGSASVAAGSPRQPGSPHSLGRCRCPAFLPIRSAMGRRLAVLLALVALAVPVSSASASGRAAQSWAAPQIATVVDVGLMGTSLNDFRPDDPLTWSELSIVVASLGGTISVVDPFRPVTIRELDAQLVNLVGLRSTARRIRAAGSTPKTLSGNMPTCHRSSFSPPSLFLRRSPWLGWAWPST